MKRIAWGLLAACTVYTSYASTIHIPVDQPTIQAGINAAVHGDTVLVAPGVYTGAGNTEINFGGRGICLRSSAGPSVTSINLFGAPYGTYSFVFNSNEDSTAILEGFTIDGGSQYTHGNSGGLIVTNSSPTIANCIIRQVGLWANSVFDSSASKLVNCRFVSNFCGSVDAVAGMSEMSSHSLGGGAFACRNGSRISVVGCQFDSNSTGYRSGGAIACENSSLRIENSRFSTNSTHGIDEGAAGGAVFAIGSTVTVINSIFEGNSSIQGGGTMSIEQCPQVNLIGCQIVGSRCNLDGGAILSTGSNLSLVSCLLANNTGGMSVTPVRTGGAIAATSGTVTLEGCTFSQNRILIQEWYPAGNFGSALFLDSCTATIGECLFAFNAGDAAIRCGSAGGATVSCSNIFGNPGGDWSGCIVDQAGNNGNFSADPLFCDTAIGDYHITDASPCAADNNSCGLLAGVFGVGCSGIPLQVKLLSPTEASGDPVYTLLPTFTWSTSTDPDPFDTVRYNIEVSPLLSKDSLLSTSYELADTLRFGTRYHWRVTAWDKSHNAVSTPYESFWTWTLGDVNKSNKCDLSDLSAMVSYLLGGGYVISPRRVGDLGGDCSIDLSDLVRLVSYLTGSGIELKPGCE